MAADTTAATRSSSIVTRIVVADVDRVSPAFVRVTFAGGGLADFGTPGNTFDQRIKLIFPPVDGVLPDMPEDPDAEWYRAWLAIPEEQRGSMRTYSIRHLDVADDGATRLVVDFVLHLEPGLTGPASTWASTARPGAELLVAGPRRGIGKWGGIEWEPGSAATVLLAGDETAAPAIARVLEDSDPSLTGVVFIEVPEVSDILPIEAPTGVEVRWLPREGAAHGTHLVPAVLKYLGDAAALESGIVIEDADTEAPVWETPGYSGLGEDLTTPESDPHADRYFWIAGESGVVTTLRRHLVKDLGIDRSQVAFMGYWRKGVAMRG